MRGVLNVKSSTLHEQKPAESDLDTRCGATRFVPDERLKLTSVEAMKREPEVRRCGRCFENGRGY